VTAREQFAELAKKTLARAEAVPSTIPEFIHGVDQVIEVLTQARDLAWEAHRATGGGA